MGRIVRRSLIWGGRMIVNNKPGLFEATLCAREYFYLTMEQGLIEDELKRLAGERARVISNMHDVFSYAIIAHATGLSRARVQQLAEHGKRIRESEE